MTTIDERLARLRGSRALEEPGARGIERVARNPDCLRLRALTIAGIKPTTAAEIMGGENKEGQSPFALVLGQRFEKSLIENGAANLFTLYSQQGLLGPTEAKIVSISDFAPGTSPAELGKREAETRRFLEAKLRRDPNAPNLIIKPRLHIRLVDVPHPIEPDFLVASDTDPFYQVGEIKSYPDRGGKTDQSDIRSACRQAAVGTIGLRHFLAPYVQRPEQLALAKAHLVLKVTGLFFPSLNRMDIEGEVDSVQRALADAPANLDQLEALLPPAATLDDPAVLGSIPNHYRSSCKEHCALWERCRGQAQARHQPIILGEFAAEKLRAVGSLARALELMDGTGAPPSNPTEVAAAAELQAARLALRRGTGNV
jgi:hypothetical protein